MRYNVKVILLLFSGHEESEPADLQGSLHGWEN